jgi:hypothetical protein
MLVINVYPFVPHTNYIVKVIGIHVNGAIGVECKSSHRVHDITFVGENDRLGMRRYP